MGRDERRKEKTKKRSVSPLFRFSQEKRPYQRLEICCCDCDIISCSTPACQDWGGQRRVDLDTCVLSASRRNRSPGFFSTGICPHHRCVFFLCQVFVSLLRVDLMHVLSRVWCQRQNKHLVKKSSTFRGITVVGGLCKHLCLSFTARSGDIQWYILALHVPECSSPCDAPNPSVYRAPHITLHFYG